MNTVKSLATAQFLAGKRTYIVGLLMVAKGVTGLVYPDSGVSQDPGNDLGIGLGLLGLRAAKG